MARRNKTSNWLTFGSMIGLLAVSVIYDKLLDSRYGDHLYAYGRWARLVVGVLMTLLWLSFEYPRAAVAALRCFAVSGLPFIARGMMDHYYGDEEEEEVG